MSWAVVLGVSGQSGSAIARTAATRLGLDVWGLHRDNHPAEAAAVARDVEAAGRRAVLGVGDAGTPESAVEGARALRELGGGVSLFVHALAGASVGSLSTRGGALRGALPPPQEEPTPSYVAPRQMERTFEVMAHSFVYWTRALHDEGVLAPGARIVGLTNPMGESVLRGTALIAASKAALEVYARHLAFELGPEGYRVNLVKFGGVFSPAVERTFAGPALERLPTVTAQVSPAGRMCTVEEVAELVCFLATPAGGWFNGATIDFTGGEFSALYDALIHPAGPRT